MFRKTLLLLLSGFLVCPGLLRAQDIAADPAANDEKPKTEEKTGDTPGPNRFWQATLAGGHFMVALDRIVSVSRHKYVLDGTLIVDEVTVDTVGQALARFYYIVPITDDAPGSTVKGLADRGRELIDKATARAGTEVQDMVMKKYPDTTHAKSIEYRILSLSDLNSLYDSVRTSWESGKGRKFATGTK